MRQTIKTHFDEMEHLSLGLSRRELKKELKELKERAAREAGNGGLSGISSTFV